MKNFRAYIVLLAVAFNVQTAIAQEGNTEKITVSILERQKEKIKLEEKESLKKEIEAINKRLDTKEVTYEEAKRLKAEAAKKRALNIENRLAIIDNKIALLERNGLVVTDSLSQKDVFKVSVNGKPLFSYKADSVRKVKYDKRTYSDLVMAVGLNNAIIEGQSLEDSPYLIGGSRFFELGITWRTRAFKNTNFLRFHYGFSFQFNGLKPEGNQYFVRDGDETELQEFAFDLNKSKFRMDNLVFPVHFEFGPSKKKVRESSIRYYTARKFKVGLGGYGGFNLGARQKLKYREDGRKQKDKLKGGYNTSSFVYGLSGYIGSGDWAAYVKYDLNPIFKDAAVEQRNISLGLRLNLD